MIPIIPIAPTIKKKVVKFIITSYFLPFHFALQNYNISTTYARIFAIKCKFM